MLEGRDDELVRLDELLAELRNGRGSALLLHGEPGIGKTALLDEVVRRCVDDVIVLRASGVQTEADLAFAALSDLVAPVLDGLTELPAPQADVLRSALALGPPSPGDRLAVCVATAGLLRIAAQPRPVLVVVDDVQWLDAASRECIRFAARRASGGLAFVLAERDPEHGSDTGHGLPTMRVWPLSPHAARAVLHRIAPDMVAAVAAVVVDAAAGNPLALVELPATLTAGQRASREPLDLPLPAGERVQEIVARRVAVLDAPARQVLLLVAAEGECDVDRLAAAAAGWPADIAALDEAEVHGLVKVRDRRVAFTHPLMRSVIWRGATSGERRAAHRSLAEASSGESRAWHLAAATVGTDDQVAVELEQAAGAASARRGYASAASALERAAELTSDYEERARRTCAAGEAAVAAGQNARAIDLFGRAADTTGEPVLRAWVARRRALVMGWSGDIASAATLLLDEADRIEGWDRRRAAPVLANAARGVILLGRLRRAAELAERAVAMLTQEDDPLERAEVLAVLGWGLVLRGDLTRAPAVWQEVERLAGAIDPRDPDGASLLVALHLCWRLPMGEFERALSESSQLVECARATGTLGMLAQPLHIMGDAAYRLGDWASADAANTEALQVAEETGQHLAGVLALACRARLDAARGAELESRCAGEAAFAIADHHDLDSVRHVACAVLGFLELGLERVPDAIGHLERANQLAERCGLAEHGHAPWMADLVEAYVRAGSIESAQQALSVLGHQVLGAEIAYPRAMHARCVGMMAEDFDAAFAEAFAWDDRRPMPFERARTQLAYGRRLHRERRRADARVQLRAALDGFERLGAAPWAAQARNELRAAGARRRPRSACDSSALSPQESRVAAAAARGGSTRDVAAELFLAPKTVEFHLGQIYRKLGVRNRAQMIVALADAPPVESGRPGARAGTGEIS
jgi:DNA-binding CsgD family transcriptional regulator